jgi:hypothetical protein
MVPTGKLAASSLVDKRIHLDALGLQMIKSK